MATESSGTAAASAPGRVKLPLPMLLGVVMLGVWLGLGSGFAGMYFLAKSGKLALPQAGSAAASTVTHTVMLDPLLVNLADEGGHAYLRLGLTLEVSGAGEGKASAPPPKAVEGAKPVESAKAAEEAKPLEGAMPVGTDANAVRDIVLTVLGRQTSASLLGPDGKEHLKIELKDAISKSNLKVDVKDVYFSDFLVQV